MGGGCRMGNGGLGVPQVGGNRDHLRCIDQPPGGLLPPLQLKGEDPSGTTLLTGRQSMLGVTLKPWIVNPGDRRLLLQPFGQCCCVAGMSLHPQLQGLQPLEEDPGIEGAHGWTGGTQKTIDIGPNQIFGTDHCTTDRAPLSINILGCRVDDDIGPQRQRLLERRGAEDVIDRQQCTVAVGQLGQRPNIPNLGQGIGGGLKKEEPGIGADRLLPLREFRKRDITHLDTKLRHELVEEDHRTAKDTARDHHMVPRLQYPHAG